MLDSLRWYYLVGLIVLFALNGRSQPVNDNFTNSILLNGTPAYFEGSIRDATAEPGEPAGTFSTPPARRSLWWTWTALANGVGDITLSTSNFAPVVKVYTGDILTNLQFAAGGWCCNNSSYVLWGVTNGGTYHIAVDSYNGYGEFTSALYLHPRPPNDDFENRLLLPPMTNVVTASNTVFGTSASGSQQYASAEPGEPTLDPPGSTPAGKSLWWSWIAPVDGLARVRLTSSGFPLAAKIFTGDSITNLTSAASYNMVGYWSAITYEIQVRQGNRYEIIADSLRNFGSGDITASVTEILAPLNDDFTNRFLVFGDSLVLTGRLEAASPEPGEPPHGPTSTQRQSVWWGWTPASSGNFTLTMTSAEYPLLNQPRFAVYTGDTLTGLTLITNGGNTLPSRITFEATAGVQYQIAVAWFNTTPRVFSLAEQRGSPPTISWVNPIGNTVASLGADIPFEVTASDADGLIERVEIFGAGQVSPPLFAPPYRFDLTNLWYGTHRITARATDADGMQTSITLFVDVPQANDNFADRWQLIGFPSTVAGTNAGATTELGEPLHAGVIGYGSVWWTWTPNQSGPVVVAVRTLPPGSPPLLGVYLGSSVNSLTQVASGFSSLLGGNNNFAVFDAMANTAYHIAVDSRSPEGFPFSLSVMTLPLNDDFTNRIRVSGDSFAVSGYDYGASAEPGEPTNPAETNRSVWWSWTAPFTQRMTLTHSNNFRSEIAVYTGGNVSNLTSIAKGIFCCGGGPTMGFDVVQGVEYQIAVNKWFTEFAGDIAFSVRPAAVPALGTPSIGSGQISLLLSGIPGRMHRLESSANLMDWTPVQTVTLTTNTFPFSTPLPASPGSTFFRAVLLP